MIGESYLKEIRDLVNTHMTQKGMIPPGMSVKVTIQLVPSLVLVEEKPFVVRDDLLNMDAIDSFKAYYEKMGCRFVRVEKILQNLYADKPRPTIRDIVLYGTIDRPSHMSVEGMWLYIRNLGKKSLGFIDEWLASLSLKRGMSLS